jgi:hypothetical protein
MRNTLGSIALAATVAIGPWCQSMPQDVESTRTAVSNSLMSRLNGVYEIETLFGTSICTKDTIIWEDTISYSCKTPNPYGLKVEPSEIFTEFTLFGNKVSCVLEFSPESIIHNCFASDAIFESTLEENFSPLNDEIPE